MRPTYGHCDNTIEFKATQQGLKAIVRGQIYPWPKVPREVKNLVREDLERHPEAKERLKRYPADAQLRVYAHCKWGGQSSENPDLTFCGESYAEHWACGCSNCPLKSVLRGKLKVRNGYLSPREIEITSLLAKGFMGKEITDKLRITESTLNTHKRHIFEKVGVTTNVELAVWAINIHLI